MTVAELIKELEKHPKDAIVVLDNDEFACHFRASRVSMRASVTTDWGCNITAENREANTLRNVVEIN